MNEYLTSFGFGYDGTMCHMRCNALFPQIKCSSKNEIYPHLNDGKDAWFCGSCCCGILMLCCSGQGPPILGDITGTQTTYHTYNCSLYLHLRFSQLINGCEIWGKPSKLGTRADKTSSGSCLTMSSGINRTELPDSSTRQLISKMRWNLWRTWLDQISSGLCPMADFGKQCPPFRFCYQS